MHLTGPRRNPTVAYVAHREHLSPENAAAIVAGYDVVLDCTDHPRSRYLVSDAAVLVGRPLVSASALGTDGQLMILNDPARPAGDDTGGPCYRCIFPRPPPAASITSCGDAGILGPVVGVMGVLQALETIKLITRGSLGLSTVASPASRPPPSLLLYSAYAAPPFRSVRLRSRRPSCAVCSPASTITLSSLTLGSFDYAQFCGDATPVSLLDDVDRVSAAAYERIRQDDTRHVLVDVREAVHFGIVHLPGSLNVPLPSLSAVKEGASSWLPGDLPADAPIYVVCRLGNDSQIAVQRMRQALGGAGGHRSIRDIRGGFRAWKEEVDRDWPEY